MKVLIITVAGTATRFNKDTSKETLKCLYYKKSPVYSLLSRILIKSVDIDRVIIVGGYLYTELNYFIEKHLTCYKNKIQVVLNEFYDSYGSGYSLIKGIEAIDNNCDEVIFVEGDLYFDSESYDKIITAEKDVITFNYESITAEKAVAFYINSENKIKYLYDTQHSVLVIPEPIKAIYNSAQIWKFMSLDKLKKVVSGLTEQQLIGTNLEIIQNYFGSLDLEQIERLPVKKWYNCNTVSDYMDVYTEIKASEDGIR